MVLQVPAFRKKPCGKLRSRLIPRLPQKARTRAVVLGSMRETISIRLWVRQRLLRSVGLGAAIPLWALAALHAQPIPPTHVDDFAGHPRVIVISDIGNEPDDQMSFVRLLLYSNELDIEARSPATSTWQKTATHPETMRTLIDAYGQVRPNLLLNAKGWPEAADLAGHVHAGQPAYGMAATGAGKASEGSRGDRPEPWSATMRARSGSPLGRRQYAGPGADGPARDPAAGGACATDRQTAGLLHLRPGRRGPVDSARVSRSLLYRDAVYAHQRRIRLRHLDRHQRRRLLPQRGGRGFQHRDQ